MGNPLTILVLSSCVATCIACGGSTPTSPSSTAPPPPPKTVSLAFSSLTADGASVTTHIESGFTVSVMSGDWSVRTTYGNPAPFVQFWAQAGTTVGGEIRVTASGSTFSFKSVDLYSSTTPIPYTITGLRNSIRVFELSDTVPNTFGNFKTVVNQNASDVIDTLSITLTNPAAPCCRNPTGLDNIALVQ